MAIHVWLSPRDVCALMATKRATHKTRATLARTTQLSPESPELLFLMASFRKFYSRFYERCTQVQDPLVLDRHVLVKVPKVVYLLLKSLGFCLFSTAGGDLPLKGPDGHPVCAWTSGAGVSGNLGRWKSNVAATMSGWGAKQHANLASARAGKASQAEQEHLARKIHAENEAARLHANIPSEATMKASFLSHGYKDPDETGIDEEEHSMRSAVLKKAIDSLKAQYLGKTHAKLEVQAAKAGAAYQSAQAKAAQQRELQIKKEKEAEAAQKMKEYQQKQMEAQQRCALTKATEIKAFQEEIRKLRQKIEEVSRSPCKMQS
jgi:hypothetical protein